MNRLWRGIAIFVFGGVLGTGIGVALGLFIFPYVFPPPAAAEQLAAAEHAKLVASGPVIHANPSDPVHYGRAVSASTSTPSSSSPTSRSGLDRRFTSIWCPKRRSVRPRM